jgi:hypothetical protein
VVLRHLEDANFGIVDILDGESNTNVLKAIRELKQQIATLTRLVESRLPPLHDTPPRAPSEQAYLSENAED